MHVMSARKLICCAPFFTEKASQLYSDIEIYRYILGIDSSYLKKLRSFLRNGGVQPSVKLWI
jgi:hypothetical protein